MEYEGKCEDTGEKQKPQYVFAVVWPQPPFFGDQFEIVAGGISLPLALYQSISSQWLKSLEKGER